MSHRLALVACGAWGTVLALLLACSEAAPERVAAPPVVAGLARTGLEARTRGLVLLGELGCVNCHAQAPTQPQADAHRGPELATVGGRVQPAYLRRFLADPRGVEPGTTMPDVLGARSEKERSAAADALVAYLLSFGPPPPAFASDAPDAEDPESAARGRTLFHESGCAACHAPRDASGAELPLAGSAPLAPLAEKYTRTSLAAFLLAPLAARPAGRMPDLHLAPSEARDLSHYLIASPAAPIAAAGMAAAAETADAAAQGRALFHELGCAACHSVPAAERAPPRAQTPLASLNPGRGCLSGAPGRWPDYALSSEQRADIRAALAALGTTLDGEQSVRQLLVARNCVACHARGDLGGIAPERGASFTGADPNLGPEGREPPPLTGVGAKLQHDWLVDAIAHGQSVRPYLRTRMPGFGDALAAALAVRLEAADPPLTAAVAALPEDGDAARAMTDLGRELAGEKGMACISCHSFAGETAGGMAAVDLVDSTGRRLRPEWFARFLRAPLEFKPGTLMPQFFPGGQTVRPELGGGDGALQISALWHYLAAGRNVGKPQGMRRPPLELVVGDETVILRRSVQHTGKRGISVGFPGGVNLSFDAERLGMNQIWWGRFLDASSVWTEQGSGEARILGAERAALPSGPCFAVLAAADAPWPAASRRELGQQFRGYDLDAEQRPVFRYTCGEVAIADAPIAAPDPDAAPGGRPLLRRTLTLTAPADQTLQFRAALAERIVQDGASAVRVGDALLLRLPPGSFRIRPVGGQSELLVDVVIRGGRGELTVEYAWREEGR